MNIIKFTLKNTLTKTFPRKTKIKLNVQPIRVFFSVGKEIQFFHKNYIFYIVFILI